VGFHSPIDLERAIIEEIAKNTRIAKSIIVCDTCDRKL